MDAVAVFQEHKLWTLLHIMTQVLQRGRLTPIDSNQVGLASKAARTIWWSWVRGAAIRGLQDV